MTDESGALPTERQFFASLIRADVQTLDSILGEDFLLIDVMTGSEITKSALLAVLGSGQLKFETIDALEQKIRTYGETAVVTGRTQMSGRFQENPFTARSRYTHRLREGSASMVAGVRTGYANHGRIDLCEAVSLAETESELSQAKTSDPSVSGSQLS